MWDKKYKDYPPDTTLKKQRVEAGKGIVGCEMHELNGWGNLLHIPKKKPRKGLLYALVKWLFPNHNEDNQK